MKRTIVLLVSGLIWHSLAMPVEAQRRNRPQTLQVPSDRYPTIQSAIDAAAPGDKVHVAPGVYREVLTIAKRIDLTGSGARGERRTEIVGSRPTEVLPVERAPGLINYLPGGGGTVEDLAIRGGHVGILGVAVEGRFPAPLEARRIIIRQGGRGVAGSFSSLGMHDSKVADMLWHGVSIVQATGPIMISDSAFEMCFGIGFYLDNSQAGSGEVSLLNDVFGLNGGGGILITGNAKPVLITKCFLSNNRYAGIRLKGVGLAAVCHNLINFTQPRLSDGKYGDGIVAECSENVIVCQDDQNFALDYLPPAIAYNARVGVSSFSSHISVSNVTFHCNLFNISGENLDPSVCSTIGKFDYEDLGGNQCSGGDPCQPTVCQIISLDLEPPDPIPPAQ